MRIDVNTTDFELVTVFDQPAVFTEFRVDRSTVPSGMYLYEVRHGDEGWDTPFELGERIFVNYFGAIITNRSIALERCQRIDNAYKAIDPTKDWYFEQEMLTLADFMKEHPPKKEKRKVHER